MAVKDAQRGPCPPWLAALLKLELEVDYFTKDFRGWKKQEQGWEGTKCAIITHIIVAMRRQEIWTKTAAASSDDPQKVP